MQSKYLSVGKRLNAGEVAYNANMVRLQRRHLVLQILRLIDIVIYLVKFMKYVK